MEIKTSDLNYVILPGRFCQSAQLELFERAYYFWYKSWSAVFKELKTDVSLIPDNFFKQDFVPVIVHHDTIVAIHLYSLYDLRPECSLEHSYLSHNFSRDYFTKLRERQLTKVMSMESLFVNPEYRKSLSGISFMEVLISLGQRVFAQLTDAHAIIAPARVDNKVAKTAYDLGFEPVQQDVQLNNVPVDLIICQRPNITPVPTDGARLIVESLWRRHIDAQPVTIQTAA